MSEFDKNIVLCELRQNETATEWRTALGASTRKWAEDLTLPTLYCA